mgnify:CR=1 FL=1
MDYGYLMFEVGLIGPIWFKFKNRTDPFWCNFNVCQNTLFCDLSMLERNKWRSA